MPPSYVGLNDEDSLRHIGEMYKFLEEVTWCTCVCCWRAWYHAPLRFNFDTVITKTNDERQWFQPNRSKIMKCDAKNIDKWMLDYDELEHNREIDCHPQRVVRFLLRN